MTVSKQYGNAEGKRYSGLGAAAMVDAGARKFKVARNSKRRAHGV